jgi:hypothetical protein
MSASCSLSVYVDSATRQRLGLFDGSVMPLCRVHERAGALSFTGYVGPAMTAVQARIAELNAETKAVIAALLESSWGVIVDPVDFTKNELIEQVLAHEGRWVDLTQGA